MGFAIRPDNETLIHEKRGVSIASINCAEPEISVEAVYPNGELEANAELIVKAVNSYDKNQMIIKVLAGALGQMSCTCFNPDGSHAEANDECNLNIARALLLYLYLRGK